MVSETTSMPDKRFPSFSDEWMASRLGEWFTESRTKGTEGIPTLSVTLDRGLVNREDLVRKQETNLTAKQHLLVRDGDIAYNMMRMWQGAFGRAISDGIVSPAYVVLRGKAGVDTRFFEYAFRRPRSIYLFWAYSYGLTNDRLRLYSNDFIRIPFVVPTLPEQRKIADFLTAVDGRIGQLIQKKALLEDYKKGVMQQLFTKAIRFKDKVNCEARESALGCDHGNDFPDWEEKKLGEVVEEIKSGLSLDQNTARLGFKVTRIETISDRTINLDKIGFVQTERNIEDFRLLLGDILLSNINSVSHIGKVAFVDQDYDLYQGMNLLRIRTGKRCSATFLFQLLKSTPFVRYFQRICNQAVSQASINQTDLKKTPISLPSAEEQTKIADFLSAIDRKIESVATQITETQTFKRGLLQQMFV